MTPQYYILRIPRGTKLAEGQECGLVRHDLETGVTTFNVKDERATRFSNVERVQKIARSLGAQVVRADNNEIVWP